MHVRLKHIGIDTEKKDKNRQIFLSIKNFVIAVQIQRIWLDTLKLHLIQLLNWKPLSKILMPAGDRVNELW